MLWLSITEPVYYQQPNCTCGCFAMTLTRFTKPVRWAVFVIEQCLLGICNRLWLYPQTHIWTMHPPCGHPWSLSHEVSPHAPYGLMHKWVRMHQHYSHMFSILIFMWLIAWDMEIVSYLQKTTTISSQQGMPGQIQKECTSALWHCAACIRAHEFLHKLQWLLHHAVLVLVSGGSGCSWILVRHPLPTCADAGPDLCTFCLDLCISHPDLACGVTLLTTSVSTPIAHRVVVTGCNLRWWC